MSLGDWSDFYPLGFISAFEGKTIFDALNFLATNILLIFGALLTSIFFGWMIPKRLQLDEIGKLHGGFVLWRFLIRFVVPPVLLLSLVFGIVE